jgi:CBS domain-containing protein
MTVKELQTSNVKTAERDTDLATVAKMMWDGDCGAVPVVNEEQKVIGMITDRDICIAAATRSKTPSELRAADVIGGNNGIHACRPEDDVRVAMRTMRKHRVRRLPVVDQQQRLRGIVSINDLAINASSSLPDSVPAQ